MTIAIFLRVEYKSKYQQQICKVVEGSHVNLVIIANNRPQRRCASNLTGSNLIG